MSRKPLCRNIYVKSGTVVRGTPPTVLRSVPSLGIAVYDSRARVGYLANIVSEVSFPHDERASSTCEPVLSRLRRDRVEPGALYAVLVGDAIETFEFDPADKAETYQGAEDTLADHEAYRSGIVDVLQEFGIPSANIHPFFTRNIGFVSGLILDTEEGGVEVQEYNEETRRVYEWISLRDGFRTIDRMVYDNPTSAPQAFHF